MRKFQKYIYRRAERDYTALFLREKKKLKKFGKKIAIEHIGSTAVQGLGGKGIIDIMIGANKSQINFVKDKLIKFNARIPLVSD
jgi:GrpB-like predicted nucleotidyltransferase (UPF0157 family)